MGWQTITVYIVPANSGPGLQVDGRHETDRGPLISTWSKKKRKRRRLSPPALSSRIFQLSVFPSVFKQTLGPVVFFCLFFFFTLNYFKCQILTSVISRHTHAVIRMATVIIMCLLFIVFNPSRCFWLSCWKTTAPNIWIMFDYACCESFIIW